MLKTLPQKAGNLHVLIRKVRQGLQRGGGAVVIDAKDFPALSCKLGVKNTTACGDRPLQEVAGLLIEGHGSREWGRALFQIH